MNDKGEVMPRHPKGSTPTLTESLIESLVSAIRGGAYVETAVALCGISKDTFYRWLRQAESDRTTDLTSQLSYAVKKALAESELRDIAVIDAAAQAGEWTAAAWKLERRFPHKWGRQAKVQVEHSGPHGLGIPINHTLDLTKLSTEELLLLEKAMEKDDTEDPDQSEG